jgi:hypothetical protein
LFLNKTINLYSHDMGFSDKGRRLPKKWSVELDEGPKAVENAALDLFQSKGWCASRDTSMLIDFILKLQLISYNELSSSVVNEILGIQNFNKWLSETRPIAFNSDKKNGWLNADFRKKIINIFPELQEEFSERDLTMTVMNSISGPFESLRHYKAKVEEFIDSLDLHKTTKNALSLLVFVHYSEFKDKEFGSKKIMYHSGLGKNFDIIPMFDNIHLVSCERMQAGFLQFLSTYYEIWQGIKIGEMKFGHKSRPLPKDMNEVKKLPEISKKNFYNYCVHGAKNAEETVSGLMKLYTSLPKTIWLDLVKSQSYRHEGFYYDTGIPDLLIWNGDDYEFVEIKSPNDSLQKSQLDYFKYILEKLSLNYSVTKVVETIR